MSKYICALFAACACTLLVLPASAQTWADTLPPAAVQSYVPNDKGRVVVVPAGEQMDEAKSVSSVLASSIDALDATTAVTVPGVAKGLENDNAILERTDSLAADAVLIVRVFVGEDEPPTAIGTFYDHEREAYSAFAIQRGETLAPRKSTQSTPKAEAAPEEEVDEPTEREKAPSEGVKPDTSDAIKSVNEQHEQSLETRLAALESRILLVSELKLVSGDGSSESRLTFYKGIHRREITPEQFFSELGRSDLSQQYERNKRIRMATSISAVSGLLGGAVLVTHGAIRKSNCSGLSLDECDVRKRNMNVVMICGGTLIAGGISALIFLETTSPLPVDPADARELAYDHNVELSEELGVPDEVQPFSAKKRPVQVDFGVGPMHDGVGAAVYGRF